MWHSTSRWLNGSATWEILDGPFLMMWNQKILIEATNSAAVADVLKYESQCDRLVVVYLLIGCQSVLLRSNLPPSCCFVQQRKRLKINSGDGKCAVEEKPTKKVLVREEMIK